MSLVACCKCAKFFSQVFGPIVLMQVGMIYKLFKGPILKTLMSLPYMSKHIPHKQGE